MRIVSFDTCVFFVCLCIDLHNYDGLNTRRKTPTLFFWYQDYLMRPHMLEDCKVSLVSLLSSVLLVGCMVVTCEGRIVSIPEG